MTREEILEFIEANPVAWIATMEDGRPHVRALRAFRIREDGPLFQISTPKDVYRQLAANPDVEVCFNDQTRGIQVRLAGKVQFVEDDAVLDDVLVERAFLQSLVDEQGRGAIKLFVIGEAMAYAWTKENNFAPKEWVKI
ncbi:MAG: pyridoxamine 5'-phosphate oxidase family protein [Thermoleophilia bacterium]